MKDSLQNSIWRIRDARIALIARAVSTAGTAVTSIAAILLLHDSGTGPFVIAAFLAVMALPTIATMGIAGRVADTVDSRTVLTITALMQALACLVLGTFPVPITIFATGFLIALAQAFAQPSWQALVPRVVGEERIGSAIAWQQGLNSIAAPIGAALGGLLVSGSHVALGFWLDGASYLLLTLAAL
ncbi:MAG: MFS transporter, partial [Actinobacteria bacterium]|nr:MFS transporter [Actinomycetota bacterium]